MNWQNLVVNQIKKTRWVNLDGWNIDQFPTDLLIASRDNKIQKGTSAVMQIVEFAHILIQVESKVKRKGLDELMEDLYYYAQKKGRVGQSEFGPFAKLA